MMIKQITLLNLLDMTVKDMPNNNKRNRVPLTH